MQISESLDLREYNTSDFWGREQSCSQAGQYVGDLKQLTLGVRHTSGCSMSWELQQPAADRKAVTHARVCHLSSPPPSLLEYFHLFIIFSLVIMLTLTDLTFFVLFRFFFF